MEITGSSGSPKAPSPNAGAKDHNSRICSPTKVLPATNGASSLEPSGSFRRDRKSSVCFRWFLLCPKAPQAPD